MSCKCHDEHCKCEEEKEEKGEKIKNIILLCWGIICLITAFILQKVDSSYDDISWSLFSEKTFFSSLSFIAFIIYTVGYLPLFISSGKECLEEIKEGSFFNENTLMLIATIGAYGICEFPESLFVILFAIIGEMLEDYATNKSRQSIKTLVNNMPLYAHYVSEDNSIIEKTPEEIKVGDKIEIRPGEKIALDGVVVKGVSSLDLSSINGESLPKDVKENDVVFSGSVNLNSVLVIQVTKEFKDSTLSMIMDLVENQENKKAKAEKFITKFAKFYTPIVMIIAILVFIIGFACSSFSWSNSGQDWLYKALSILLISCPCSLVISVPITFFASIGTGSKYGILIKGSIALEDLASAKTIMFDKTGTLTKGTFALVNKPSEDYLQIAASLEAKSTHPLAKAITNAYTGKLLEVEKFENIPGFGIKGVINNKEYVLGNKALLENNNAANIKEEDTPFKVLYLGKSNKEYLASFIVADEIKEETKTTIQYLKNEGFNKTIMLSGDDKKIAETIGKEINLDEVKGELLPDQKLIEVENASKDKNNKTVFVGDGINDSPSILASNVGIAMGALGSDAAIEASDIVIMDDNLTKVAEAKHLAKQTLFVVYLVIFLSLFLKLLVMVLVLTNVLGEIAMIISAISDTGVMIICVLVALTMSFYKPKYLSKK